uniref:Profilin n=1 Tax=Anabas testudineus TaxID=64144 RepID=A0A7N6AIU6_ANATE
SSYNGSTFGQCSPTIGPYKCRMLRNNKDTDGLWCIDFKTAADAEGNTFSVCVGYTLTAIVIGIGTKEASGGQVSAKVFGIVTYLRQKQHVRTHGHRPPPPTR